MSQHIKLRFKFASWSFCLACSAACIAQSASGQVVQSRLLALTIGNAEYTGTESKLRGPDFDAIDVAEVLESIGFTIHNKQTGITDLDRESMANAFEHFFSAIDQKTVALVYFSGHGFEDNGRNFLAPTDSTIYSPADLDKLISLNWILKQIRDKGALTVIVILDACRQRPVYLTTKGSRGGLAQILNLGRGTKVIYAASAGQPSMPAPPKARNSVFTAAFLESSKNPKIATFDELLRLAAKSTTEMAMLYQRVQEPYEEGTLAINFNVLPPNMRPYPPGPDKVSRRQNDECQLFDCTKK